MPRVKQLETILTLALALVVVYLFTGHRWLLTASVVIGAIGLFIPSLAALIHEGWMLLAKALGFVMSKVILAAVFYLFLFPIATLARLFSKKDPLHLKRTGDASLYTIRNHSYSKDDLLHPW